MKFIKKMVLTLVVALCIASSVLSAQAKTLTDEYVYYVKSTEVKTSYLTNWMVIPGQLPLGTSFSNTSSGMYWQDTGDTVSGSVTVGFSTGVVTLGLNLQVGRVGGSTGKFLATSYPNQRVKFQIRRQYSVKKYYVYKYNKYSGISSETFDHSYYTSTPIGEDFRCVLA